MPLVLLPRRSFLTICLGSMTYLTLPAIPVLAGRLTDAVANLVEGTYESDIDLMSQDEVDDLAEDTVRVSNRVRRGPNDMRGHVEDTWDDPSPGRRHTERCPYCISVAQEVEDRNPALTPVNSRIPNCFYFGGVPYAASNWGTLHRIVGGQIGPAEGHIVFQNGQYFGVGRGGAFPAQGVC